MADAAKRHHPGVCVALHLFLDRNDILSEQFYEGSKTFLLETF